MACSTAPVTPRPALDGSAGPDGSAAPGRYAGYRLHQVVERAQAPIHLCSWAAPAVEMDGCRPGMACSGPPPRDAAAGSPGGAARWSQ